MSSSGFPPKNRPLIGIPDRSANQRPDFLVGNSLNSCHFVLNLISEKTDFSKHSH